MKREFLDKLIKVGIISLIVCILLEIFVFNYKSFVFMGDKFRQITVASEDAEVTGANVNGREYTATGEEMRMKFHVNEYVRTMKFDIDSTEEQEKQLEVGIEYTESAHRDTNRVSKKSFNIIYSMPETKYVTCSYTGETYDVTLKVKTESGQKFIVSGLTVNEKIPFNFSMIRVFCLFIIIMICYIFAKYPTFKESMNFKYKSHVIASLFAILIAVITVVFIMHMYVDDITKHDDNVVNQISKELVDSFENGQVSLLDPVPEEILNLVNPYDWTQRTTSGVNYKWDHLLYEGKYYSYYGIGPVLTLFLPYHKITGHYFSTAYAICIYSVLAAVFIALVYLSVIRNWFKKTPMNLTLLGLFMTLAISGVTLNVVRPKFYELAQSSGLCFTAIGIFFMVNSGIFQKKKIRKSFLFLSSLFMSLSVLSRVTGVFYCVAMVIWIAYGLFQNNKEKGKSIFEIGNYLIAALAPYIVFGLIQMKYNYARFGSIFDFGIQYSLTINDFTQTRVTIELVMLTLINTLCAIPVINTVFPFIHGNYDAMQINGYYFLDTPCTMGVIVRGLPILSILYAPKLSKNFDRKEKIKLGLIWLLPGVIFPLIMVAMTYENGYSIRYGCDYAWELMLSGIVVAFYVYNRLENQQLKKWLYRLFVVCTVWAVASTLAATISVSPADTIAPYENIKGSLIYYKLRNLIMFWN